MAGVMTLDRQICSRARLSRDARFDGKFFIAVLTSGVYCRSICPARTAQERNVRYYPTAAAAAEAGYRPCLRCRPECSPGTPAWLGTPSTVTRALRLIDESGLEDGGVESLAERLGVGARHLRRLFLRHLGATPSAVAQTRRMNFAKKLIDETTLPMNQIALASGFGCVRRFNAGVRKVYRRTPTQIRKLSRHAPAEIEDQYSFRLRFRPPFSWKGMLAFLAPRATPGVEEVDGEVYRRTIRLKRDSGFFEVSLDEGKLALLLKVKLGNPQSLFFVVEQVRSMFDLNADWSDIVRCLQGDPVLARRMRQEPGLRVPGCWDGFELTVRAILGQQVTVRGATTLAGRLAAAFGRPCAAAGGLSRLFPTPQTLAVADLAGIGLTVKRARTITELARAVCDGRVRFDGITDTEAFLASLREIPGIGEWTAQYVAMRALREPDAFPCSDLGLLRALNLTNPVELEHRAAAWRPWRAYAAMYLWSAHAGSSPGRRLATETSINGASATPYSANSVAIS